MSLISGPRGLEGMETTTARNLGKADLMLYLGVDRSCTSVIILFQSIIIYLFIKELNLADLKILGIRKLWWKSE